MHPVNPWKRAASMEELHICECTNRYSTSGEVWCGNGTYNDMRSYIHGHDLCANNSSSSKLLNNPPRPCTEIMRHTKMDGVLREFADSDKMK